MRENDEQQKPLLLEQLRKKVELIVNDPEITEEDKVILLEQATKILSQAEREGERHA